MVLYYIEIKDILERAVPEAEDISVAKITETVLEPIKDTAQSFTSDNTS
jgi:hypothetical protein